MRGLTTAVALALGLVPAAGSPGQESAALQKACDDGVAAACSTLGARYAGGQGVAKDAGRAARLFEKACDGGHAGACFLLATLYVAGEGVSKNASKALGLLEKACGRGDAEGCYFVGRMYDAGSGAKDPAKAAWYYEKACRGGETRGCRPPQTRPSPLGPDLAFHAAQAELARRLADTVVETAYRDHGLKEPPPTARPAGQRCIWFQYTKSSGGGALVLLADETHVEQRWYVQDGASPGACAPLPSVVVKADGPPPANQLRLARPPEQPTLLEVTRARAVRSASGRTTEPADRTRDVIVVVRLEGLPPQVHDALPAGDVRSQPPSRAGLAVLWKGTPLPIARTYRAPGDPRRWVEIDVVAPLEALEFTLQLGELPPIAFSASETIRSSVASR